MKQSICALLVLGAVLQPSDGFVTNPNRNSATQLHTPSLPVGTDSGASTASVRRWASTMDEKKVDEKASNDENDLNKDDDINNFSRDNDSSSSGTASLGERITNSGVASAAAMATAERMAKSMLN